jgi:hypothetical protein
VLTRLRAASTPQELEAKIRHNGLAHNKYRAQQDSSNIVEEKKI